jgi:hypothetical protein
MLQILKDFLPEERLNSGAGWIEYSAGKAVNPAFEDMDWILEACYEVCEVL